MQNRIVSIDVLRGLTILLMIVVNTPGSWSYVYPPLLHAKWHGCTPTDLVFPSFLFIIGLTMAISFKHVSGKSLPRIFKRGLLIFLVGLLLNWFPFYNTHLSDLRIFGVLQRIALAFLGAAVVITVSRNQKTIIVVSAVALLLLHWLCLTLFGSTSDPFSLAGNFSRIVDLAILSENQLYGGFGIPFDPEGLLGTLSSIAQVLFGYLTARFILQSPLTSKRVMVLALAGIACITGGLLLDLVYPINKPLWTGSYVFYTSGIIICIWAAMMWLIDVRKISAWTYPFQVVGTNPLISYVFSIVLAKLLYHISFAGGNSLYSWLYANVFQSVLGNYLGSLAFALTVTGIVWLVAWWLYRRKIVVKL